MQRQTIKTRYLFLALLPFFLSACFKKESVITAFCEKDSDLKYILKWETTPHIENTELNIYISGNDSSFPDTPQKSISSDDFICVVDIPTSIERPFFKLKIGSIPSGIVSNRYFKLDSIQNFRDIGGYYTKDNRQIKWGKLYRSGTFTRMTARDQAELSKLKLKTVIDLRSQYAIQGKPFKMPIDNYIKIPLNVTNQDILREKIINNQFYRGDALVHMQDLYKDLVENQMDNYAMFYDQLCNESNYPIAFNCFLGKDQVGIATYFLLLALGVTSEVAEKDYLLSNTGINKDFLMKSGDVSEAAQEAMTTISTTDISFLRFAISCIIKKSGSIDDYMTNDLKLTSEKRKQLRSILLY